MLCRQMQWRVLPCVGAGICGLVSGACSAFWGMGAGLPWGLLVLFM
mgnify:CR=1 FL=1